MLHNLFPICLYISSIHLILFKYMLFWITQMNKIPKIWCSKCVWKPHANSLCMHIVVLVHTSLFLFFQVLFTQIKIIIIIIIIIIFVKVCFYIVISMRRSKPYLGFSRIIRSVCRVVNNDYCRYSQSRKHNNDI